MFIISHIINTTYYIPGKDNIILLWLSLALIGYMLVGQTDVDIVVIEMLIQEQSSTIIGEAQS